MNQKEAIKLAVVENNMKNIETKLDVHIAEGKQDSIENKQQQKAIIEKLDVFREILETKADKIDVEKVKKRLAYWSGAIGVIVFILTFIITNINKIERLF